MHKFRLVHTWALCSSPEKMQYDHAMHYGSSHVCSSAVLAIGKVVGLTYFHWLDRNESYCLMQLISARYIAAQGRFANVCLNVKQEKVR